MRAFPLLLVLLAGGPTACRNAPAQETAPPASAASHSSLLASASATPEAMPASVISRKTCPSRPLCDAPLPALERRSFPFGTVTAMLKPTASI